MTDASGTTLRIESRRPRTSPPASRPQLIVALECSRPQALSARYDLGDVRTVTLGRGPERCAARTGTPVADHLDVRVPDSWMSSRHARIDRSFGHWLLSDTGSKNGVLVNGKPVDRAELHDGDLFELGHTLFLFRQAADVSDDEPADLDFDHGRLASDRAAGRDRDVLVPTLVSAFAQKLAQLRRIAASAIPIILSGESGTGKEVVARAVHRASGRKGAFVAVNCGAIPGNLVESELFGHKRGAFSGAIEDRPGLVRSAHTGTLFLDEIGDLPPPSQAALLRVLQEREVMPVGAAGPVAVDVRVISATHRDLDALVAEGSFRHDLFARLAGFRLTLPPLSQRRDDIGLLAGALLAKVSDKVAAAPVTLECEAARQLFCYSWPLNVRELEQVLATAAVLAHDAPIAVEHLPDRLHAATPAAGAGAPELDADDARRKDELMALLREHRGNVSAVARAMDKDRKQIQRWLKRYRLSAVEFRD